MPAKNQSDEKKRQVLIVLGMHRTGTSALGGVLARLGAQAPSSLMPPTQDNPRGYWESTALMKFHDRILASAGTRWSDWDTFNPDWMGSPACADVQSELKALLQQEYGDARLFLVKDPRMCRLLPIWLKTLESLAIAPKVVIPVRHPAEAARSLEARDHMTIFQSSLMWLRHMLDAERSSRAVPRVFVRYADLLNDWRSEVDRIADRLDIRWPARSGATEADIEAYIAPDLRHHVATGKLLAESTTIGSWLAKTLDAMGVLVDDPDDPAAIGALDDVGNAFNKASAIFAPVVHEQRLQHEQKMEGLESKVAASSSELAELSSKHAQLKEENLANYQSYVAEQKANSELRRIEQEHLAATIAAVSKQEAMHALMTSRLEQEASARSELESRHAIERSKMIRRLEEQENQHADRLEQEARARSELESRHAAERNEAAKRLEEREAQHAETVAGLHAEIRRLNDSVNLAEESIRERFAETATLTKSVLGLEERLAEQRQHSKQLTQAISRNEMRLRAFEGADEESKAKIRALELEVEAQRQLITEYREQLQGIQSSKSWRAITAIRRIRRSTTTDGVPVDGSTDTEILRRSNLLDSDWYLRRYPDVRSRRMDPIKHYLEYGAKEGRDPSAIFSTTGYTSRYPDVVQAGVNPLVHYLKHGRREGRLASSTDTNDSK